MRVQRGYLLCTIILNCLAVVVLGGCSQVVARYPGVEIAERRPSAPQSLAKSAAHIVDKPMRLIIPSIQVDAMVEAVGVLASGDLDTPRQNPWTDVGWYEAGPRPGQRGSAVMDGHLDRPGGFPAVFWNLRNIHAGDKITVIMSSGKKLLFHVTSFAFYPPEEAPLQAIFGDGSGEYLNLITCAGDWIPSQHQTTLRMVVYASSG
ncbi:MAG TPA: class F sortase [Ktedonobacteraceae bacterium]|jgi:sortase (surface protein transpeptidase)|nr:class F sortase [Ktedonobacteraceae bacterium]